LAYEELRSTGSLGLLRDDRLKAALFDYYSYDDGQRQFQSLQIMTEIRHFELAAKILSNEQRVWVQNNYYVFGPRTVDGAICSESKIDAVADAARRLQDSPDFIAWLPEARGMQLDLMKTNEFRLQRAESLLSILRVSDGS
jgi:hypothetical protein